MNYFQHIKCATQKDRILDQCYTNVKDIPLCLSLCSDDLTITLFNIPRYMPLEQREPTVTRTIKE